MHYCEHTSFQSVLTTHSKFEALLILQNVTFTFILLTDSNVRNPDLKAVS